jgi:uncharacterized protein YndB with AHSA1/START domain
MESTTDTIAVTRDLVIEATPETVWEYLVDPDKVTRWMGQAAAFELEEGGLYRIEVLPGHTARGTFVDIDPPRRLVYTWGWEAGEGDPPAVPAGSSTVEIELTAEGAGTRLSFIHRDLPDAEAAASHSTGWDHYLARLVDAAGGGDPGRDPWLDGGM